VRLEKRWRPVEMGKKDLVVEKPNAKCRRITSLTRGESQKCLKTNSDKKKKQKETQPETYHRGVVPCAGRMGKIAMKERPMGRQEGGETVFGRVTRKHKRGGGKNALAKARTNYKEPY